MMREAAVVDPVAFSLEDLALRGALVDAEERLALLPRGAAEALGLPEEVRLTDEAPTEPARTGADARILCALGSPLLMQQVAEARAQSLLTWVRPVHERVLPPRPSQARALAERFVVRNGLATVLESFPGESTYVAAHLAYSATADDRHEGSFVVVAQAPDGAEPDEEVVRLLDPADPFHSLPRIESRPGSASPSEVALALPFLRTRAEARLRALVHPLQERALRRYLRDRDRIADYFAELIREAGAPKRRLDPAAVAAKVAHLTAERDAKLSDLPARFALRVQLGVIALVCARLPVVRLTVRVQRRKLDREIVLRLPAGAHALDRMACDGCSGTTARPALCDDRLHVLCEVCVPSALGRPRCPACQGRAG
ncbi:MAG: hypothetical protein U1A78_20815 [Polyangia bacterium]